MPHARLRSLAIPTTSPRRPASSPMARLYLIKVEAAKRAAVGRRVGQFLWVCFAGACGTGARFLLSDLALRLFGPTLPVATFAINVAGSFLIGAVMELSAGSAAISPA